MEQKFEIVFSGKVLAQGALCLLLVSSLALTGCAAPESSSPTTPEVKPPNGFEKVADGIYKKPGNDHMTRVVDLNMGVSCSVASYYGDHAKAFCNAYGLLPDAARAEYDAIRDFANGKIVIPAKPATEKFTKPPINPIPIK